MPAAKLMISHDGRRDACLTSCLLTFICTPCCNHCSHNKAFTQNKMAKKVKLNLYINWKATQIKMTNVWNIIHQNVTYGKRRIKRKIYWSLLFCQFIEIHLSCLILNISYFYISNLIQCIVWKDERAGEGAQMKQAVSVVLGPGLLHWQLSP